MTARPKPPSAPTAREQAVRSALLAWLDALNLRESKRVTAAMSKDVVVRRHQPGEAALAETLEGRRPVAAWVARTPEGCLFSVDPLSLQVFAGRVQWQGEVRYVVEVEGYSTHGTWKLHLATDGRIDLLEHLPDAAETITPPRRPRRARTPPVSKRSS